MLKTGAPRVKRRNVEKRREKSRYAARNRREKEAGIFTDLYVTVPIVSEPTITHVDRIAVLRLAATLCRIRRVAEKVFPPSINISRGSYGDIFSEASITECMDGLLIMADSTGLIIYISPNCSRSLGLTQTDVIGQNIHDYLHADDSASMVDILDDAANSKNCTMLRMKSVLSPRGRNLTLKSAVYKAVSIGVVKKVVEFPPLHPAHSSSRSSPSEQSTAKFPDNNDNSDLEEGDEDTEPVTELDNTYYIMFGTPMVHCGVGSMGDHHSPGTFMTRHGMDMKFSYCHDRMCDYLGYDSKSLVTSSFYSLVHPEDLPALVTTFKELYHKGHALSGYYRLLVKSGGYVWVTTTASVVTHSSRGHGGQYIICVHQIISGVDKCEILADVQQTAPALLCKMESDRKVKHTKIIGPTSEQLLQRATTVNDYVPLPNPSSCHVNTSGLQQQTSATLPQKRCWQAAAGRDYQQDWLFRGVGGIESKDAGQRGACKCSNATIGLASTRVHVGVAERSSYLHCSQTPSSQFNIDNSPLLLSTHGTIGTVSQADIKRILFSTLPSASSEPTNVNISQADATKQANPVKKDNLSMLAPFVHESDEILSLDFGPSESSTQPLSPSLIDQIQVESGGHDYLINGQIGTSSDHISTISKVTDDKTMEKKVKIESICRYLRQDDGEGLMGAGNETEVDFLLDQDCPALLSNPQHSKFLSDAQFISNDDDDPVWASSNSAWEIDDMLTGAW